MPLIDPFLLSFAVSLDKLLDTGLYTGELTEIVGGPGSGKTQVPMQPASGRTGEVGVEPWVPWWNTC